MLSVLTLLAAGSLALGPLLAADDPGISAKTADLSVADLASALGVRYWSYQLRFERPVSGVSVRLCELRRQSEGDWVRTPLASGHGFKSQEARHREAPLVLIIPDKPGEQDFALRLGENFSRSKFTRRPDFSRTYTTPQAARFIAGCLILAYEEKDPHAATGREENMVRLIGLEITTE